MTGWINFHREGEDPTPINFDHVVNFRTDTSYHGRPTIVFDFIDGGRQELFFDDPRDRDKVYEDILSLMVNIVMI